jgi:RCR-type E3 ubiquitin transferase
MMFFSDIGLGIYVYSYQSIERQFLRDLVQCTPGTSGGRLARWLQPESFVEPRKCEVLYAKEDMRCGWPAIVTILSKDQYGHLVNAPNLKVKHPINDLMLFF